MAAARSQAYYVGEQFEEAASWARKALARNPRSTRSLRLLAASLAKAGERTEAADVIREILAIEPELTIGRIRARLNFWPEAILSEYADGLRIAGLPD
jgi:tetratricopeptide (TPR) repeat protein